MKSHKILKKYKAEDVSATGTTPGDTEFLVEVCCGHLIYLFPFDSVRDTGTWTVLLLSRPVWSQITPKIVIANWHSHRCCKRRNKSTGKRIKHKHDQAGTSVQKINKGKKKFRAPRTTERFLQSFHQWQYDIPLLRVRRDPFQLGWSLWTSRGSKAARLSCADTWDMSVIAVTAPGAGMRSQPSHQGSSSLRRAVLSTPNQGLHLTQPQRTLRPTTSVGPCRASTASGNGAATCTPEGELA